VVVLYLLALLLLEALVVADLVVADLVVALPLFVLLAMGLFGFLLV
jgi:hypothetical protein